MSDAFIGPPGFQVVHEPQSKGSVRPQDLDGSLREAFSLRAAATGGSTLRARYSRPLATIMVVVGLVPLIACANIANLLLARATARRHERMREIEGVIRHPAVRLRFLNQRSD